MPHLYHQGFQGLLVKLQMAMEQMTTIRLIGQEFQATQVHMVTVDMEEDT